MANIIFKKHNQGNKKTISESYTVTDFITKENFEDLTFAVSHGTNHKETTKNKRSNRIYYLIEGFMKIHVGNKVYNLELGDIIFIEKNTQYSFEGTFKAVLIDSPSFMLEFEEIK